MFQMGLQRVLTESDTRRAKGTDRRISTAHFSFSQRNEAAMYLTFNDFLVLFPLICFAGFCSYLTHEVQGAILSYLHDEEDS